MIKEETNSSVHPLDGVMAESEKQDPPAGISGAPQDNNILLWNAVIFGPDDTPWNGGTFKLTLQFTEDYPNKPPTVRFVSWMFHPNSNSPANSEAARLFSSTNRLV